MAYLVGHRLWLSFVCRIHKKYSVRVPCRGVGSLPNACLLRCPVQNDISSSKFSRRYKTTEVASDEATFNERRRKERYIPITRRTLVQSLINEESFLDGKERACFEAFSAALDGVIAQRYYRLMEEAKHLYEHLDPDQDTIKTKQLSRQELLDAEYWLLQKVERLLEKANYSEIQKPRLYDLLKTHPATEGVSVSVDLDDYETLRIWVQGKTKASEPASFGNTLFRYVQNRDQEPESVYSQVFVAVRSKSEAKLNFKVFKQVPCKKLEYLLPNGKIEMSRRDKLFFTTGVSIGGAVLGLKLLSFLADFPLDGAWIILGVTGIVGARVWVSYKNKRNQYLLNMSKLLYFKTLANNKGALALVSDRAQEEDFKEAILSYSFLVSPPNRRGIPGTSHTDAPPLYDTPGSLRARVDEWISRRFGFSNVRFDVEDALGELECMGLLVQLDGGKLSVQPIEAALNLLPTPVYHQPVMKESTDTNSDFGQTKSSPEQYGWR